MSYMTSRTPNEATLFSVKAKLQLGTHLTNAVHVTAARLRFWLNVKSLGWAAARDSGR